MVNMFDRTNCDHIPVWLSCGYEDLWLGLIAVQVLDATNCGHRYQFIQYVGYN